MLVERFRQLAWSGAHERNRTFDLLLTKEVLYRLSYVSEFSIVAQKPHTWTRESMERETGIEPAPSAWKAEVLPLNYSRCGARLLPQRESGGGRWIRTTEGVSQQIYSLPPLAAWVSLRLRPRWHKAIQVRGETARNFVLAAQVCQAVSNGIFTGQCKKTAQTLKRKCRTSPSCTRYSLPSRRKRPASRAPASPLYLMKSP